MEVSLAPSQTIFQNDSANDIIANTSPNLARILARAISLVAIAIGAVGGNILVLGVLIRYRKLRTSVSVLVGNLSVANTLMGLCVVFMVLNVVQNRNALGSDGCRAWALTMGTALCTSTFTMALIAASRYMIVVHGQRFKRVFVIRNSCLMSLVTWLVGAVLQAGMVFGWSDVRYNQLTKACSYARDADVTFNYFIITTSFAVPLLVVIVCYSMLFYAVRKSRKRTQSNVINVRPSNQTTSDRQQHTAHLQVTITIPAQSPVRKGADARQNKLTKMLITIFLVYVCCLGPYSITNVIDQDGSVFPEAVHIIVTWILLANSAVNPVIYGIMNENFREAYIALLGCKRCRCANRHVGDNTTELDIQETTI